MTKKQGSISAIFPSNYGTGDLPTLGGDEFIFLPRQKILFGGDVVVNRFFPIMPDADANGTNWIKMLGRLEKMNPAIVVPGHGEVGDASLITKMREYLGFVRDRVQQTKSQGDALRLSRPDLYQGRMG